MLLDSNVLIYASRTEVPEHAAVREFLRSIDGVPSFVSEITRVEVLGYSALTAFQLSVLSQLFSAATEVPITPALDQAIALRQMRRGLRTPDALIAATARVNGLTLVTHNVRDFEWMEELTVLDPLA